MRQVDVAIAGAGLAGLACALHLHEAGHSVLLLEGADAVGGRVRTDAHDGFLLDRGFQVLLTAYPEASRVLDLAALDLKPFEPGALVRTGGRFARLVDPYRRPAGAMASLLAPVGTLTDKWKIRTLRRRVRQGTLDDLWHRPNQTTRAYLQEHGFSDEILSRFFRPWMGGVFFDPELETSSRMFEFVFRMFSEGDAAVPAGGMQRIPEQLAARLPAGVVRTRARVLGLEEGGFGLAGGERISARAYVVATGSDEAERLLPELPVPGWRGVTCLYFAADRAPMEEPMLVLNGEAEGPVNNFHVASQVAPSYAPAGAALCAATVVDDGGLDAAKLEDAVRTQLGTWFGDAVRSWRHLRTYRIPHALPDQRAPALTRARRPARVVQGRYVCGDHRDHASIEGALLSGHRVAQAVVRDLAEERST